MRVKESCSILVNMGNQANADKVEKRFSLTIRLSERLSAIRDEVEPKEITEKATMPRLDSGFLFILFLVFSILINMSNQYNIRLI
jgi:hypothetical protein